MKNQTKNKFPLYFIHFEYSQKIHCINNVIPHFYNKLLYHFKNNLTLVNEVVKDTEKSQPVFQTTSKVY